MFCSHSVAAVNRDSVLRLAADASRGACPSRGVFVGPNPSQHWLGRIPSSDPILHFESRATETRFGLVGGSFIDWARVVTSKGRARKRVARRCAFPCTPPSGEEHCCAPTWMHKLAAVQRGKILRIEPRQFRKFQILRIRGQPIAVAVLSWHGRDQGKAERFFLCEGVSTGSGNADIPGQRISVGEPSVAKAAMPHIIRGVRTREGNLLV